MWNVRCQEARHGIVSPRLSFLSAVPTTAARDAIGTPFIATPRRPGLSTISQQSTPAARERGDKIIKQKGAERRAAAFESAGPHAIGDKCRIDECNRRFW
jgi:hypothetical protein